MNMRLVLKFSLYALIFQVPCWSMEQIDDSICQSNINEQVKLPDWLAGFIHPGLWVSKNGIEVDSIGKTDDQVIRVWEYTNYKKAIDFINTWIREPIKDMPIDSVIDKLKVINKYVIQDHPEQCAEILGDEELAKKYQRKWQRDYVKMLWPGEFRKEFKIVADVHGYDCLSYVNKLSEADQKVWNQFVALMEKYSIQVDPATKYISSKGYNELTDEMRMVIQKIGNMRVCVPPHEIETKVKALIIDIQDKLKKGIDPFRIAAIAHNQLVYIHPFYEGNGRTARLFIYTLLSQTGEKDLPIFFDDDEYTQQVHMSIDIFTTYLKQSALKAKMYNDYALLSILENKKNADTLKKVMDYNRTYLTDYNQDMCFFCSKAGSLLKCGGCKQFSYCSKECQSKDWKGHKFVCKSLPKK